MPLDTVYLLGEVAIFALIIYYLYVGLKDKRFSIVPLILGLVAWFLSSLTYYEIVRNIGVISTAYGSLSPDIVGSAAILLAINNYVLMFIIILSIVYVVIFIVWKVVEGAKKWRR